MYCVFSYVLRQVYSNVVAISISECVYFQCNIHVHVRLLLYNYKYYLSPVRLNCFKHRPIINKGHCDNIKRIGYTVNRELNIHATDSFNIRRTSSLCLIN